MRAGELVFVGLREAKGGVGAMRGRIVCALRADETV